jgi:hypothetical protein
MDLRNFFQYIQKQHEEMMQSGKGRFTSTVLIGGLFPRRDITDEGITDFDLKFRESIYYQGSSDANAGLDAREKLGNCMRSILGHSGRWKTIVPIRYTCREIHWSK